MPAHTLRDGREGRESPILHILEVRKQKRWGQSRMQPQGQCTSKIIPPARPHLLSQFSITVLRHHDSSNLKEKEFI